MRLHRYSAIEAGLRKPLSAFFTRAKRLAPPETPDECRQSDAVDAAYDVRHSVRSVSLCVGVYFVAVVLGWCLSAVVVAAWFRPS